MLGVTDVACQAWKDQLVGTILEARGEFGRCVSGVVLLKRSSLEHIRILSRVRIPGDTPYHSFTRPKDCTIQNQGHLKPLFFS